MPANPTITADPKLAIERAFVALLQSHPELSSGIDIVAASDRESVVGPLHVFVLCTEWAPVLRLNPNGRATVAIGLVGDMDDHADVRRDWLGRVLRALTGTPQPAPDYLVGALLLDWAMGTTKEESQDRQVMDVIPLRVAACVQ